MSSQENPNVETTASSSTALCPSAFIAEPHAEISGWDARLMFDDEAPVPRIGHPEDLDQDDIPTVKLVLEVAGQEASPELLARAEPISHAPSPTPETAPASTPVLTSEPDEQVTFTFIRNPIPTPDFKARLVEIHRRAGFIPRLAWWIVEQQPISTRRP